MSESTIYHNDDIVESKMDSSPISEQPYAISSEAEWLGDDLIGIKGRLGHIATKKASV